MSKEHEAYEIVEGQFDDASLATGLLTQEDDEYSSTDEHLARMELPPVEDSSTSAKPTDGILKASQKKSPLDMAKSFLGLYVVQLRWDTQKSAYRQFGEEFLRQYSHWYHESQNIKKAEALSAYKPGACQVNTDFLQPCDRVREGTAYQSLLATADAKCNEWSLERGAMHLKVRRMNNDAAKEAFIELVAHSMWRMARILLSTILSEEYDAHNLVADMLILHHQAVLKKLCSLEEFIRLYKKINKCGRDIEDPDVMFARRFGIATESDASITNKDNQTPASPNDDAITHDIHNVPPTTAHKNTTLPSTNLFGDDEKSPTEQSTTPTPSSLEELHKIYRQKIAMLIAAASDSQNLKKMTESSTKFADLGKWGEDLIEKEGGIYSAVASKITDTGDDEKPPASPKTPTKTPTNCLASPKLIYDQYSRRYRFTREETCEESMEWLNGLDDTMKKQLCKDDCIINSIRSRLFQLPGESTAVIPPAPTAASLAAKPPVGNAPATLLNKAGAPQGPPDSLNSIPCHKIEKVCETLRKHCVHIFNTCVVVFERQCSTNKIIENISASEKELTKTESAAKATAVAWKNTPLQESRAVHQLVTDASQKAAKEGLRKTNNNVDAVQAELVSLRKEVKKLRRENNKRQRIESTDGAPAEKEPGGLDEGARKRNPYSTSTATNPNSSTVSPKKKQQKNNKKKKGVHLDERKQKHRETPLGGNQRGGQNSAPPVTQESSLADDVLLEHAGRGRGKGKGRFPNKSWKRGRDSDPGNGRGRAP